MTKLIPLEEVEKYTIAWTSWDTFFNNQQAIVSWLNALPTIDPIAIIDEMIKNKEKEIEKVDYSAHGNWYIFSLLELKSRLYPLTQK